MNRNIKCFIGVILLNYDLCKDKCNSQENWDKLRALKVKYFKFGIIKLTKLYKYLCSAEDTDSAPLLPAGVIRVRPDTGRVGHHLGQSQLLSKSFKVKVSRYIWRSLLSFSRGRCNSADVCRVWGVTWAPPPRSPHRHRRESQSPGAGPRAGGSWDTSLFIIITLYWSASSSPVISRSLAVQRIPVNHCPVPFPGAIVVIEAGSIAVGEDAEWLAILCEVIEGVWILHRPGDVMEPAVITSDGHRVRVISRHQHWGQDDD